jgi:hypothetical protein
MRLLALREARKLLFLTDGQPELDDDDPESGQGFFELGGFEHAEPMIAPTPVSESTRAEIE